VAIVALEESGHRTLSGLATLMPVFTLVAYFIIGEGRWRQRGQSGTRKWVLVGTLVSWVPYMFGVAYLRRGLALEMPYLPDWGIFLILAFPMS